MTTAQILAVIGLALGLVVAALVVKLLNDTLKPLLAIKDDVMNANTAPMLKNGVPGTEQLGTTRRLAESVPPLALAYLAKLGAGAPPPPAPAPWTPAAPAAPAAPAVPAAGALPPDSPPLWNPPAWHKYRR